MTPSHATARGIRRCLASIPAPNVAAASRTDVAHWSCHWWPYRAPCHSPAMVASTRTTATMTAATARRISPRSAR